MFSTILLPVDFEINTEMAVKKALELSDPGQTVIHLFHVQKPSKQWNRLNIFQSDDKKNKLRKLLEWNRLIEANFPDVKVVADLEYAPKIETAIIEKARRIEADIILIGKHSFHGWQTFRNTVFPNNIAKATGYPVLTFKPGSVYTSLKSIVVPVGSVVPQKKVNLIIALKRKFKIAVHLVSVISETQNDFMTSGCSLIETFRYLKNSTHCPLDHKVLFGENVAKEALKYANSIKADMLMVEPESETRLSTFPIRHITDELQPHSKLQVLAVRS